MNSYQMWQRDLGHTILGVTKLFLALFTVFMVSVGIILAFIIFVN